MSAPSLEVSWEEIDCNGKSRIRVWQAINIRRYDLINVNLFCFKHFKKRLLLNRRYPQVKPNAVQQNKQSQSTAKRDQ